MVTNIIIIFLFSSDALSWDAEGVCFEIKDRALLSDILADHFKHRKFSSFQRQLNYFSFRHVKRGVYKNANFTRDDQQQAMQIARKTRNIRPGAACKAEPMQPKLEKGFAQQPTCSQASDFDAVMESNSDGDLWEELFRDDGKENPSPTDVDERYSTPSLDLHIKSELSSAQKEQREKQRNLQIQLKRHLDTEQRERQRHLQLQLKQHLQNVVAPASVAGIKSSFRTPFFCTGEGIGDAWKLQYQPQPPIL